MFRVVIRKGRTFVSGGFGIDVCLRKTRAVLERFEGDCTQNQDDTLPQQREEHGGEGKNINSGSNVDQQRRSHHDQSQTTYLFAEETLFLHERGLLQVLHPNGIDVMSSKELFRLLEELGFPLPIYLTYAYLRSQTFIVLRHADVQWPLKDGGIRDKNNDTEDNSLETERTNEDGHAEEHTQCRFYTTDKNRRKLDLRQKRLEATTPKMLDDSFGVLLDLPADSDSFPCSSSSIAFDVFNPNSKFRKSNPGRPDYYVAVSFYNGGPPSPTFDALIQLLQSCEGIPLRLATVSDSGTVIMFGITDVAVPRIESSKPITASAFSKWKVVETPSEMMDSNL